jgi:hypothetical protein
MSNPTLPHDPLADVRAEVDRDGFYLKSSNQTKDISITGIRLGLRGGRAGVINDMNVPYSGMLMQDVHIDVFAGEKSRTMWGVRRHNLISPTTTRVRVLDHTRPGASKTNMMEHAFYDEIHSGEARYVDCSGKNIPAQLLQIRLAGNRSDPKWSYQRRIVIERLHGREVGQERGAGRAAFALSVKDCGPNGQVHLSDLDLECTRQQRVAKRSDGTWADSFAAVCVEYCNELLWQGGRVAYKNPRTEAVQLFDFANKGPRQTGPESIRVSGVRFEHGNGIALRVDDTTRRVDIEDCVGSGLITVYRRAADGVYRVSSRHPISQGLHI